MNAVLYGETLANLGLILLVLAVVVFVLTVRYFWTRTKTLRRELRDDYGEICCSVVPGRME